MATRLYFSSTGAAAVSPAFDAAWTSTGSAVRRALRREYDSTALTNGSTISWTSGQVALDRQYVSPPLAAQTLSGNVRMQLRAREIAGTDNVRPYLGIHVFSEDGTTYRATLLTVGYYSSVTELPTTQTNTPWADGDALSSYTCVDGDRIVVEVGYSDVAGTTPQALARYGAPVSTEFGEDNTETADYVPWIEFHTSVLFRPLTGAPNQSLEWAYGTKNAPSRTYWGTPNQSLEAYYAPERLGPFVRGISPNTCGCCITTSGSVSFVIGRLLPATVDLTTLVVTFTVNGTPVVVYDDGAGGFQPGYSGTLVPVLDAFEDLHAFTVTPDAGFAGSSVVEVQVEVADSLAVALAPPVAWTFCVLAAPPVPPSAPTFRMVPPEVSIRGGAQLLVAGDTDLVDETRTVVFDGLSGWSTVTSGSGAVSTGGLRLDTGLSRLSVAGVESPDDYDHVDAEATVRVPPTGLGWLAVLEARTGSGALCRVLVERNVTGVLARGEATVNGQLQPGGAFVLAPSDEVRLRIVRNGSRVFGFVDGLSVMHVVDFATDAGPLRVYTKNTSNSRLVSRPVRVDIGSHVRVGERLLEDKVEVDVRRIVGRVPAAALSDVGPVDVTTFGVFGSRTVTDALVYVLPVERTLTASARQVMVVVQDPVLKDGE